MRNNGQHQQRGGQQGRSRQGQGSSMRGHQGPGRQPQYGQQYGRQQQGYEHPENRYRERPQSSGWRSQSSASWEDEDLRGYGEEFGGLEGNEQQRWDRWTDDESFTEQQYGEQRDRFGNEGARGYYGGSQAGLGAGRGFTGPGEFEEQGREGTTGGSYGNVGRQGGFGSQSYGGMGWRGERSGNLGPGGSHLGTHLGGMGQQREPQRYARGPKGYKRSDERIKEDVSDRISQLHDVDASDVELEVKGGEVTLTGSVPTRNMKWQLETLVDSVAGVTDVNNQLRIKRESSSTSGTEKSSGGPTRK